MDTKDYKNSSEGKRVAAKYADIINMKRPESKRPKMDLTHRAKIFSPYDALRGYDEAIADVTAKTDRVQRKQLSEEEAAVLSDKLIQVKKGIFLTVTYFASDPDGWGNYKTIEGTVMSINSVGRYLEIEEPADNTITGKIEKQLPTIIDFDDLLDIEGDDIQDRDDFLDIN